MPDTKAIFLPEGINNHCPAKMTLEKIESRLKRQFKYCNVQTLHPEFLKLVEVGWRDKVSGCKMLQVVKRLNVMKKSLKKLNTQHFKNIVTEAQKDRQALQEAQRLLQNRPPESRISTR